ncbi:MAG: hypothetical protein ACRECW_04745 [Phyllobacterium sp.]
MDDKGRSSMEAALELLMAGKAVREGNRQRPDEVEARLVSTSLQPGVTANIRFGANATKLHGR